MTRTLLGRGYALYLRRIGRWMRRASADPAAAQDRIFGRLIRRAERTWFGRQHDFASIRTHADFVKAVPVGRYVTWVDLIDRMFAGERDVTWPGRPRWFAQTSGTTIGDKRIPITRDLKRCNYRGGQAVFASCERIRPGGFADVMAGQLLFLGATIDMDRTDWGAEVGHLSGISATWTPRVLSGPYEPGWEVARIRDWEGRLEATARRIAQRDVRLVTGIPSWMKVLFDRVCELRGVPTEGGLSTVWPQFTAYVHWGTGFGPYREVFRRYFRPGHDVAFIDSYAASEAFVGFQTDVSEPSIEMFVENGVFFEFVPLGEREKAEPRRLTIGQVEPGETYVLLASSCAGLWAYDFGDLVRVVSRVPPRFQFAGRHEHYMNAFGEHVIGQQVTQAVESAIRASGAHVTAFTVAPRFPDAVHMVGGHEFVVEFESGPPADLEPFAREIDRAMIALNNSYADKRRGGFGMVPPRVTPVPAGTFQAWLKVRGRFDAYRKVPVCREDRTCADEVLEVAGGSEAVPAGRPGATGADSRVPRGRVQPT